MTIVGAEQASDGLLQDERHAPGREQRFQRARVEIADHEALDRNADDPRDDEGERNSEGDRPILQRRGQNGLHHIRRIGAEHHHFAMRHVDDAHDAESDRKANRREQQNRCRREAIPEILRHSPHGEAPVDRGQRGFGGALDRRVGRLLHELVDQALCVFVATFLQRCDRREAVLRRRAFAGREDRRAGEFQRIGDARVGFLLELRLERRQRLDVASLEHVAGRRHPLLRIRVGQGQRPDRALNGLAQRVVDPHFLESGDVGLRDRLARLGVEHRSRRRPVGDEMIGGVEQQAIIAERIQYRGGLRRRLGGQFTDRFLALRKLVGEKAGQGVIERVRLCRRRERQQGDERNDRDGVGARHRGDVPMCEAKRIRRRHGSLFGGGARWRRVLIRRVGPPCAASGCGAAPLSPLSERGDCGDGPQPDVSRRICPS